MRPPRGSRPSNAVRDLVDADRELALLRELIQAASSGPGVEPLAAAAAGMITAATASDVCFVHVLDDTERSLTLAGAMLLSVSGGFCTTLGLVTSFLSFRPCVCHLMQRAPPGSSVCRGCGDFRIPCCTPPIHGAAAGTHSMLVAACR